MHCRELATPTVNSSGEQRSLVATSMTDHSSKVQSTTVMDTQYAGGNSNSLLWDPVVLGVWLQVIYTTKVIILDLQNCCSNEHFSTASWCFLLSFITYFWLHFQKGEKLVNWCWKACRKGLNKYVMQSQPLWCTWLLFLCVTSSLKQIKIEKFKSRVGITIKGKETSGKLCSYLAMKFLTTHFTSCADYYLCLFMQTQFRLVS